LSALQFVVFCDHGLSFSQIGWQVTGKQNIGQETLLYAVIAVPLGIFWIYVIEPVLFDL